MRVSLKPTHADIVIHHLQTHGEIDRNEARKYSIFYLPEVISRLRLWGHHISTVRPDGKPTKYVLTGVV